MTKRWLKAMMSEKQILAIRSFRRALRNFGELAATRLVNFLPAGFIIAVKSRGRVIRKLDYKERDVYLNINSGIELQVRLRSCEKEPEMIGWIHDFVKEGDVLYDIGANVGAYSLIASKHLSGRVSIFAFEPGFMTFQELCRNIITNGCQESITALQIALSDETSLGTFNYNNLVPGGALHAFGDAVDCKGEAFSPVFRQRVLSFRIDDLIRQFRLPVPNHLKIDVDGIEHKILIGAGDVIRDPALKSVILELEEGSAEANAIVKLMSEVGFTVMSKHRYVYGGNDGPYANMHNYIFERARNGR